MRSEHIAHAAWAAKGSVPIVESGAPHNKAVTATTGIRARYLIGEGRHTKEENTA
jgi:hypothetical protein